MSARIGIDHLTMTSVSPVPFIKTAAAAGAGTVAVKNAAHEHLLTQSGGNNLSETLWLKVEIADAEKRLAAN